MSYDKELAARIRVLIAPEGPADERRMFGGLAFKVDGSMAVCASQDGGLLVRVARVDLPGLLGEHVEPMTMGGRVSRTWVRVASPVLRDDTSLKSWVQRGVRSARAASFAS